VPNPTVTLARGREKSLRRRHPWVYSGALARVDDALSGEEAAGATVDVLAADGTFLARGAISPASRLRVRTWTFDPEEAVDETFFRRRLERALAAREPVPDAEEPAGRRLVYGESDGLPGIVVDRYGEHLVAQFLSAGAERWKGAVIRALGELVPAAGVYERSHGDARAKEGLEPATGVLAGEAPPELVEIREGACRHLVDVRHGHKTGFYLDQRENRMRLGELVAGRAAGARVLNVFAYTGGFGHAALAAGAEHVTHVESSPALGALLARTAELNDFGPERYAVEEGNAFSVLRGLRAADRRFDLVILDPPKFADTPSRVEAAARGYKDVNLLAFQLLEPGGYLVTFSCSGALKADLFQKIVADAALDARRDAHLLHRLEQAPDHPTALPFPEGTYLKGLVCRCL
jgi:23S rRNA (cytosine1962-C5)-methyltransferase